MHLNFEIREQITDAAIQYAFKTRIARVTREYRDIVDSVYDDEMKPWAKQIAGLPEKLLNQERRMTVKFGPSTAYLEFDGEWVGRRHEIISGRNGKDRPFLRVTGAQYSPRHPFTKRWDAWSAKSAKLREEVNKVRATVSASLGCARTVKQLLEQWPEAKRYLPAEYALSPAPLPVIQSETLNTMLSKARATT